MTHDAWMAEIAAARKKFEDQNAEYYKTRAELYRRRPPGGDREGARRLPLSRQAAEGADDDRVGRLRHRALRAPRAARLPPGTDHERRVSIRRHRSGCRLRGRRRRRRAARRRAAGRASRDIPIVCITGDAGFGYTPMEIDTMAKYRLPAVVIVYNNNAWGTWTQAQREPRALPIHLFQENLRYDKVAEALGGHGEYVTQAGGIPAGARTRLPGGGERGPAGGHQLPGEEGILGSREVPTGRARQDRARRDVVLPLSDARLGGVPALRRSRRVPRTSVRRRRRAAGRVSLHVAVAAPDARRVRHAPRRADVPSAASRASTRLAASLSDLRRSSGRAAAATGRAQAYRCPARARSPCRCARATGRCRSRFAAAITSTRCARRSISSTNCFCCCRSGIRSIWLNVRHCRRICRTATRPDASIVAARVSASQSAVVPGRTRKAAAADGDHAHGAAATQQPRKVVNPVATTRRRSPPGKHSTDCCARAATALGKGDGGGAGAGGQPADFTDDDVGVRRRATARSSRRFSRARRPTWRATPSGSLRPRRGTS